MTILGPGLLGASLGMAARQRGLVQRVRVWARRAEARNACLGSEWCDSVAEDPAEAVRESEIVVLCTPVDRIAPLVERVRSGFAPGALLTDVGSTKARICRETTAVLPAGVHFVGSHPMAGSEKTGMENAREDLFNERACIVTPLAATSGEATARIVHFWEALGMRVTRLSPEEHDRIVAAISHLPHMLASLLCSLLAEKPDRWKALAGTGLLDTTRVAAGSSGLWTSICEHNRDPLLGVLEEFRTLLAEFSSALREEDWKKVAGLLEEARLYRQDLQ
ncbi:MAG: prephenate dehydrogenase/arogenate dehydrogenase family protein [Verrucomicrobia bacterium]|jgi:prephenate dehydrogenase|nr:prephenate dehydrogenase/arogenate dehydrogenase family protein [Verrucomicrobiota bacterium]